jgi:hypothetical protein
MVGVDVASAQAAEKGRKRNGSSLCVVARSGRGNFGGASPFFEFCTLIAPVLDFPSDQGLLQNSFIYQPTFSNLRHPSFFLPPSCRPKVCLQRVRHLAQSHFPVPAIREYDAKLLLAYWLERAPPVAPHAQVKTKFQYPAVKVAQISWDAATDSITPDTKLPGWVFNTKLVAKPDQLIKRRGKAGLLALNKTWDEAKPWIAARAGKPQKVCLVPLFCVFFPWHMFHRCLDSRNVLLSIHLSR